jgi:hypothetical protein
MTKLSVIIPTYNRSKLIADAIDSVIGQRTGHRIEIIVVDDGSEDDTRNVVRKYKGRVQYLCQPNRGMNAARNYGVREATGEYIAFLDSDDAWLPLKAEMQISVMDQVHDAGFAFSNFFAWRNGARFPDGLGAWMVPGSGLDEHVTAVLTSAELGICPELEPFAIKRCEIYRLSLYQPVVLPSTSVVRRHVFAALGPLDEDNWMCGDWEFFARASKQFGAVFVDQETTLNRSHDDAVRLMRRALTERTKQRLASIARTWRADTEFLAAYKSEVDRVETREWKTLFKRTCQEGNLAEAGRYLGEIARLTGSNPYDLRLLWWLFHVPGSRTAAARLRAWLR